MLGVLLPGFDDRSASQRRPRRSRSASLATSPRPASPACLTRGVIDASSGAPRVGPPGAAPPMTMMTTTRTTVLAGRRAKGEGRRAKGEGRRRPRRWTSLLRVPVWRVVRRRGARSASCALLAPNLLAQGPPPSFLPSYLPSDFCFVSARTVMTMMMTMMITRCALHAACIYICITDTFSPDHVRTRCTRRHVLIHRIVRSLFWVRDGRGVRSTGM